MVRRLGFLVAAMLLCALPATAQDKPQVQPASIEFATKALHVRADHFCRSLAGCHAGTSHRDPESDRSSRKKRVDAYL